MSSGFYCNVSNIETNLDDIFASNTGDVITTKYYFNSIDIGSNSIDNITNITPSIVDLNQIFQAK